MRKVSGHRVAQSKAMPAKPTSVAIHSLAPRNYFEVEGFDASMTIAATPTTVHANPSQVVGARRS